MPIAITADLFAIAPIGQFFEYKPLAPLNSFACHARVSHRLVLPEFSDEFLHRFNHVFALGVRRIEHISTFTKAKDEQAESVTFRASGTEQLPNLLQHLLGFRITHFKCVHHWAFTSNPGIAGSSFDPLGLIGARRVWPSTEAMGLLKLIPA